jgi:hypothetical protein
MQKQLMIKMEKRTLEFTKQEAEVLLSLINTSVKVSGLENNVAKNAIYFQDKLNNAFSETFKEKVETQIREKNLEEIKNP